MVENSLSENESATHIPGLAAFILQHHLTDFIRVQLKLARVYDMPMLRAVIQMPEEQIIEMSLPENRRYLEEVSNHRLKEEMIESHNRWVDDQIGYTGKYDVVAEDITKGIYLRNKALKSFIPQYTSDLELAMKLVAEIDDNTLENLTLSTQTLIQILHERIVKETHFSNKLLVASPGMIFLMDVKTGKQSFKNQHNKKVLGFAAEDLALLGPSVIFELTHPEDLPNLQDNLHQIITSDTNDVLKKEFRLRNKTGEYCWMRTYFIPFSRDEKGALKEILGESFDITGEKEIEIALQRREEQLTEAQVIAGMGSFEWNFRDQVSIHSEQINKIFELEKEQLFEEFMQHVHPDDKEKVQQAFEASLKTGQYECEYRYMVKEREKYLWAKGIVHFEHGKPFKMVGTVQDITERRKMEEVLLQKTIELEKINKDLSEFTYVASHDLKEPLRKIAVFADMLNTMEVDNISETGKGQLEKILESSKRMRDLIDDILALSSVSAHQLKENVSLEHVLGEVLGLLDHTIRQRQAIIETDGLPEYYAVPVLMRQLFLNLIGNSLKFSSTERTPKIYIEHAFFDKNKIHTSTPLQAAFLQLKFIDNGIGFDNEFSDKIFMLFSRLHGKNDYEGTGLGLSICKRIVEEHGGTIRASSTSGQGATFTIFLPLDRAAKTLP